MKRLTGKTSGQTLLEVMIALFVLTTGFLGILSLLAQSLSLGRTISNQTIATYLAAEGIEVTKNLVDHDVYADGFKTGWGDCFKTHGGDGNYEVDYTTVDCATLKSYSSSDFLDYDSTTHQYQYGNGTPTIFTRLIRVKFMHPADEVMVQSTVTWSTGAFTQQSVILEDYFFNWHP